MTLRDGRLAESDARVLGQRTWAQQEIAAAKDASRETYGTQGGYGGVVQQQRKPPAPKRPGMPSGLQSRFGWD